MHYLHGIQICCPNDNYHLPVDWLHIPICLVKNKRKIVLKLFVRSRVKDPIVYCEMNPFSLC